MEFISVQAKGAGGGGGAYNWMSFFVYRLISLYLAVEGGELVSGS